MIILSSFTSPFQGTKRYSPIPFFWRYKYSEKFPNYKISNALLTVF